MQLLDAIRVDPLSSYPAWSHDIEERRRALGVACSALCDKAGVVTHWWYRFRKDETPPPDWMEAMPLIISALAAMEAALLSLEREANAKPQ